MEIWTVKERNLRGGWFRKLGVELSRQLSSLGSNHSKNGRPTCGGIVQCDHVGELILLLPDPGSRGQKSTGSRIPDPGYGSATLGE